MLLLLLLLLLRPLLRLFDTRIILFLALSFCMQQVNGYCLKMNRSLR